MREREPSRTALGAAAHRAIHQVADQGRVFSDPLAIPILGEHAEAISRMTDPQAADRRLRLFIAARSRVAEDALKAGVETRGVRQLVVFGAGLDTFAYRNPFADLQVFEVDHPATQAWKRRRLAEVGIAIPPSLTFAPVDFETQDAPAALRAAGVDPHRRTFFMWLGVIPYLTRPAVLASLAMMAGFPGGAEVVFDYSDPPATLPFAARVARLARAASVAAVGEPFLTNFDPPDLHAELKALGFRHIDDLGPRALMATYYRPGVEAANPDRGGHVLLAATSWPGA